MVFAFIRHQKKRHIYNILTEQCNIANLEMNTWEAAIRIYADLHGKRFTVGEIDILIAAFCLANNCILVTNNIDDFKNIDGLKLSDWTQANVFQSNIENK